MKKRVVYVAGPGEMEMLGEFELVGVEVRATYKDKSFRRRMEAGIVVMGGERVRPSDGVAFWNALDKAFANSSREHVVLIDE